MGPILISISILLYSANAFAIGEPVDFTANIYAIYTVIGMNTIGAVGWIVKTWWEYHEKKNDKTKELLEVLTKSIDDLKKDVHYLTVNSASKMDVSTLVREEIEYVSKIRGDQ